MQWLGVQKGGLPSCLQMRSSSARRQALPRRAWDLSARQIHSSASGGSCCPGLLEATACMPKQYPFLPAGMLQLLKVAGMADACLKRQPACLSMAASCLRPRSSSFSWQVWLRHACKVSMPV